MMIHSPRKIQICSLLLLTFVGSLALGLGLAGGEDAIARPNEATTALTKASVSSRSESTPMLQQISGNLANGKWSPPAIFNDGSESALFTVEITGGDFNTVWVSASGVLDADTNAPESVALFESLEDDLIQIFDDGTNGDVTAGDSTYSRGGVTASGMLAHDGGSHQRVDSAVFFFRVEGNNVQMESITTDSGLGVVDALLRGTIGTQELEPGLSATSHALFLVDDGTIYPNYPNVDADGAVQICNACGVLTRQFGDLFDFIVLYNIEVLKEVPNCGCQAFFVGTRNDVEGIGNELRDINGGPGVFSSGGAFNTYSDAKLRGIVWMNRIDGSALSHELMHRWSVSAAPSLGWLDGAGHYQAATTVNGMMDLDVVDGDGFLVNREDTPGLPVDLVANGDGTFRLVSRPGEFNATFAPFSLYLAGFLPAAQVPSAEILMGAIDLSNEEALTATSVFKVTIDSVIAIEGPRVPSSVTSPKDFRVGTIVISDRAYSEAEYAFVTLALRYWESDKTYDGSGAPPWKAATLGLSSITVELPLVFPSGQPATRIQTLRPSWNLVGWTGDESPIGTVTAGIVESIGNFSLWDANALAFLSFNPALPTQLNKLQVVPRGAGVWTFVSSATPLAWEQPAFSEARSVDLVAGFNLVMWTGPDGTPITEAIADLAGAEALFIWDAAAQRFLVFNTALPPALIQASELNYGAGIWLLMAAAGTWEQPASEILAAGGDG